MPDFINTPVLVTTLSTMAPAGSSASIHVDGYSSVGDGGEGTFIWNSTSTATPDTATLVKVNGVTTGRWNRVIGTSPQYSVKWFGAKGDNATDDTAAIQLALDTVPQCGVLYFPPGIYLVTSPLIMRKTNIVMTGPEGPTPAIEGEGGAIIVWSGMSTAAVPTFNNWAGPLLIMGGMPFSSTYPYPITKTGNFYCLNIQTYIDPPTDLLLRGIPFCLTDSDVGIINGWGHGDGYDAFTGFTFECWVNPDGYNPTIDQQSIIASSCGRRDTGASEAFNNAFNLSILNNYHLLVTLTTTNGIFTYHSTNTIPSNSLTHVAVTYDQNYLRLFIDGYVSDALPCTGTIVQESWEDFCIGALIGQYVLQDLIYGVVGNLQLASIRLSSSARYTTNFTPSTTELGCIIGNSSVAVVINFDPQFMLFNNGWIRAFSGQSSLVGSRQSNGCPVYLWLGHESESYGANYNIFNGAIISNLTFASGSYGENIFCYAGNAMTFRNLDLDACQSGITLLGGYYHLVDQCVIGCSTNLQCHSWGIGSIQGGGGSLNKIVNCSINGGWYSIFSTSGFNIYDCFFNNCPAFCGLGVISQAGNLGSLNVTNCMWDDEGTGTTDSGIYVTGMDNVLLRSNNYPGTGNSSCVLYKIGNCGYVELTDNYVDVNLDASGLIQFVGSMLNNQPVIINTLYNQQGSDVFIGNSVPLISPDSIYNIGDGYTPVQIPTNEVGVYTVDVSDGYIDGYLPLSVYTQTWGTLIITDITPVLTGPIDVIYPYLWANTKKTVVNNTAQVLTFIGLTGTGVSVPMGAAAIIYCNGTKWIQLL